MVIELFVCICVVLSRDELKVRQNLPDSDYKIYMVRLLVASVNWHKSLQFVKKIEHNTLTLFIYDFISRFDYYITPEYYSDFALCFPVPYLYHKLVAQ